MDGSVELEKDAEGIGAQDPNRGRDVTWIITAGERIRSRAAEAVASPSGLRRPADRPTRRRVHEAWVRRKRAEAHPADDAPCHEDVCKAPLTQPLCQANFPLSSRLDNGGGSHDKAIWVVRVGHGSSRSRDHGLRDRSGDRGAHVGPDLDGRGDSGGACRVARQSENGLLLAAISPAVGRLGVPWRMRNSVRKLRSERGLSQGQLASEMGVSRQTINSIEQDRYTPSLPLALALARFFETTVEAMFDEGG